VTRGGLPGGRAYRGHEGVLPRGSQARAERPTRCNFEMLGAYISVGFTAAAHELGITETTTRQHLSGLHRRTGCVNAAQAAYLLGRAEEQ
jgi:predicted ArsR family transcriptional regulator